MISFAPLFGDSAILQRGASVAIWGSYSGGDSDGRTRIRLTLKQGGRAEKAIEFGASCGEIIDGACRWEAELPPHEAGGPYILRAELLDDKGNATASTQIQNLYFGDVFFLAGQSNIEFRLSNDAEFKSGLLLVEDDPMVRMYRAPRVDYPGAEPEICEDNQRWVLLDRLSAGRFSAAAYYFATDYRKATGIPVGFLDCNRGGTSAAVWVDEQTLEEDADLRIYLEEYRELLTGLDPQRHRDEHEAYYAGLKQFQTAADRLSAAGFAWSQIEEQLGPYPWPPPSGPLSYRSPCGLFHTMTEPLIPYSMCAVLYYQGEEDVPRAERYKKLLTALILLWRRRWHQEIPFLLVQIPPFDDKNDTEHRSAYLREAQEQVAGSIEGVGLVITTDCGEKENIHPTSKRKIGDRLSKLARRKLLGEPVEVDGPRIRGYLLQGPEIEIQFQTGSALCSGSDSLNGFAIAGRDGVFYPADATIDGNAVRLRSKDVSAPIYARYAFGRYVPGNLQDRQGNPAAPMRTDTFAPGEATMYY